jgi:hypothetical protein
VPVAAADQDEVRHYVFSDCMIAEQMKLFAISMLIKLPNNEFHRLDSTDDFVSRDALKFRYIGEVNELQPANSLHVFLTSPHNRSFSSVNIVSRCLVCPAV